MAENEIPFVRPTTYMDISHFCFVNGTVPIRYTYVPTNQKSVENRKVSCQKEAISPILILQWF